MRYQYLFPYTISVILLLLLNVFNCAAEADTENSSYDKRIEKLESLLQRSSGNFINLNEKYFNLLLESPRDYHVVILATAVNPQFKCEPCRAVLPEFVSVANSWNNREPGKLYFGVLDYINGRDVFKKLNILNVPNIIHIKPGKGYSKPEFYDFPRQGISQDNILNFIVDKTDIKFELEKPTDYSKLITIGVLGIIGLVAMKFAVVHFSEIITNKKTWMIITLSTIFLMISGFMWVHIRHPPSSGASRGKLEIFVPGFQQQYAIESQIILIIYIFIAFGFLIISDKVPNIKNSGIQRLAIYVALGIILFFLSVILRVFYYKSRSYPFKLFL